MFNSLQNSVREVTESAVWGFTPYVNIECLYYKFFEHISASGKLTSDYTLAHANSHRELATDCTQRLSAFIVHILKMSLAGQNRLVYSRGRTAFIALISN